MLRRIDQLVLLARLQRRRKRLTARDGSLEASTATARAGDFVLPAARSFFAGFVGLAHVNAFQHAVPKLGMHANM